MPGVRRSMTAPGLTGRPAAARRTGVEEQVPHDVVDAVERGPVAQLALLRAGVGVSSKDPDLGSRPYASGSRTLDAQNYFDFAAVYTFAEKYTMNAGINNFLDEEPPLTLPAGRALRQRQHLPAVYDALGRYVFVGLTAKF